MYVCMFVLYISLWQGRTAMADCQSISINQSHSYLSYNSIQVVIHLNKQHPVQGTVYKILITDMMALSPRGIKYVGAGY